MRLCAGLAIVLAVLGMTAACRRSMRLTEVSESPSSAHEPSLAASSGGFLAAWYDRRSDRAEIFARHLGPDGAPRGPELRLTAGPDDAYEPDVRVLDSGDFVIGWYEKSADGLYVPLVGRWTSAGERRWAQPLAPSGRNTVVLVDGDSIFAAWLSDEDEGRAGIWAGWWHQDGRVSIPPRRVADASRTTANLNAAADPATTAEHPRAWVVFDATVGSRAAEVFGAEVSRADAVVRRLTPDDGIGSRYPDLAFLRDRVALTWFDTVGVNDDVRLAVGPRAWIEESGTLGGHRVRAVTDNPGHSIGAYLAWNDRRVGLAWCDDTVGQFEVHFQAFDDGGAPLSEPRRLTDTAAASLIPAIEPWGQGFALVWNEYDARSLEHDAKGRGQIVSAVVP